MIRNNTRIHAMMILYNYDITNVLDYKKTSDLITSDLEGIKIDYDYSKKLVDGVNEHKAEIDKIITINLINYTINRLSAVDRNIIRIAVYEMKYEGIPANIIINEMLDITREYSYIEGYDTVKFNNAVLDNIAKFLKENLDE